MSRIEHIFFSISVKKQKQSRNSLQPRRMPTHGGSSAIKYVLKFGDETEHPLIFEPMTPKLHEPEGLQPAKKFKKVTIGERHRAVGRAKRHCICKPAHTGLAVSKAYLLQDGLACRSCWEAFKMASSAHCRRRNSNVMKSPDPVRETLVAGRATDAGITINAGENHKYISNVH